MGEAEPVGSVGEEGVVEVGVENGGVNSCDPISDGVGKDGMGIEEGCQPGGFLLESEGGDAAEDEADEEDREPEPDGSEKFGFSLGSG